MMDWTDRHCRYFLRLCSPRAFLYTEMIATGALIFGDAARLLAFDQAEHPLGGQLGGSDPAELALCARKLEDAGYDEVNLNVGCPSERVQRGAFGACLMSEPALVAQCVRAMRDAVAIPVTVKNRIGIDRIERYDFVRDFVGTVAEAGCATFIVHARNAYLKGLSPKENREVPPLKYDYVHRLKRDFPALEIVINGGFCNWEGIEAQLQRVDGVMLGRVAYHNPWMLVRDGNTSRADLVHAMHRHARREVARGTPLRHITRHLLGLYYGHPRAGVWRRMLSDPARLAPDDPDLLLQALDSVSAPLAAVA